jgi:hypothetical protein
MLKLKINAATKDRLLFIARDLFLGLFVLLAVFNFLEIIKPRIVTSYVNLDYFLLALVLLGLITVFYYQPVAKEIKKLNFLDYLTIILFSILIGIFGIYLTKGLGYLSILVGLATAIISYYFIILCYKE